MLRDVAKMLQRCCVERMTPLSHHCKGGQRTSQRLKERIKQHVPRSIANPPASPNRQSLSRSSRPTHAHNNFLNPPLVNIFLTTPNALFTTATKNFLFSLEVALLFTFLLLKRLSLNLSIPFCVSKKNSSNL